MLEGVPVSTGQLLHSDVPIDQRRSWEEPQLEVLTCGNKRHPFIVCMHLHKYTNSQEIGRDRSLGYIYTRLHIVQSPQLTIWEHTR